MPLSLFVLAACIFPVNFLNVVYESIDDTFSFSSKDVVFWFCRQKPLSWRH